MTPTANDRVAPTEPPAGALLGVEPLCCVPTAAARTKPEQDDVADHIVLAEARAEQNASDLQQLYEADRARQVELQQAQAQMLAYANDLRSAFRAERTRRAELERAYVETVRALARAIEARDPYTGGHVDRVAAYAVTLGKRLDFREDELRVVEVGALLHDVGKIAVADAILRKAGPLDDEEWAIMRQHPTLGASLLGGMPSLQRSTPAVLHHHERFDGQGYPSGLAGERIPVIARLVSIADAFDAMLTDRPYRKGLPLGVAVDELERCAGTQFDPELAQAFVECVRRGQLRIVRVGASNAA